MRDNESAKRHMSERIGGRVCTEMGEEMVFRVERRERPGSMLQLLGGLGKEINISMCH